jgi:thiol-disulfide isomerase/thioredoxin
MTTEGPLPQTDRTPPRSARLWMLALVSLLALAVMYLGIHDAREDARIRKGAAAPPFKVARYSGGKVSLEELRGKVVMLDFWATWCAPCAAEMPTLTKLAGEYESAGLVFLAANRDDAGAASALVKGFVAQRAPNLGKSVVFADDQMAASYGLQALPTLYFIGRDGRVLESHSGYASESHLRRQIESALGK